MCPDNTFATGHWGGQNTGDEMGEREAANAFREWVDMEDLIESD
jgi:hypothetical protein